MDIWNWKKNIYPSFGNVGRILLKNYQKASQGLIILFYMGVYVVENCGVSWASSNEEKPPIHNQQNVRITIPKSSKYSFKNFYFFSHISVFLVNNYPDSLCFQMHIKISQMQTLPLQNSFLRNAYLNVFFSDVHLPCYFLPHLFPKCIVKSLSKYILGIGISFTFKYKGFSSPSQC